MSTAALYGTCYHESKELNQALKNPTTMLVSDDNDIIGITGGMIECY